MRNSQRILGSMEWGGEKRKKEFVELNWEMVLKGSRVMDDIMVTVSMAARAMSPQASKVMV